jgi:hypothetical protein
LPEALVLLSSILSNAEGYVVNGLSPRKWVCPSQTLCNNLNEKPTRRNAREGVHVEVELGGGARRGVGGAKLDGIRREK